VCHPDIDTCIYADSAAEMKKNRLQKHDISSFFASSFRYSTQM